MHAKASLRSTVGAVLPMSSQVRCAKRHAIVFLHYKRAHERSFVFYYDRRRVMRTHGECEARKRGKGSNALCGPVTYAAGAVACSRNDRD